MGKVKKAHIFCILFVAMVTIYNILPTLFYYLQPLQEPINEKRALAIQEEIAARIEEIDEATQSWIIRFCSALSLSPISIEQDPLFPTKIQITFSKEADVDLFRLHFPRANAEIVHASSSLLLRPQKELEPKKVVVERAFASFPDNLSSHLTFSWKRATEKGKEPTLYQKILLDRMENMVQANYEIPYSGPLSTVRANSAPRKNVALFSSIALSIDEYSKAFGKNSPITKRYLQKLRSSSPSHQGVSLEKALTALEKRLTTSLQELKGVEGPNRKKSQEILQALHASVDLLKTHPKQIDSIEPLNTIPSLENSPLNSSAHTLLFDPFHPFFRSIELSWEDETLTLFVQEDVRPFLEERREDKLFGNRILMEEIRRIVQVPIDSIKTVAGGFQLSLSALEDSRSILALDLWKIADQELSLLEDALQDWHPTHPELQKDLFPLIRGEDFTMQSPSTHRLGILLVHPRKTSFYPALSPSIYVIVRGLTPLLEKYKDLGSSPEARALYQDLTALQSLLQERGFVGYPGEKLPQSVPFSNDFVFEKARYFQSFLTATAEKFQVDSTKRYALLELKNVAHRLRIRNQIDTEAQERLIQEKDLYNKAQVSLNPEKKSLALPPRKQVFWSNCKLSWAKYFRGDERKVLRWGVDLCGGKAVTLSLHTPEGEQVVDPEKLDKSMRELEHRINRLGVAETTIRREGSHLVIDFPGSQDLSAKELIQGSSMFFHVLNEQFSNRNLQLQEPVSRFLQEIWNEALLNSKKDSLSLQRIACSQLYGDLLDPNNPSPRSPSAKLLYDQGLRLALPGAAANGAYDTHLSKIALYRQGVPLPGGKSAAPLCIVFHNHALEGTHLTQIQPSHDSARGNVLRFSVKRRCQDEEGFWISPQEQLFSWTSQFAKGCVLGTPFEEYTRGSGYRMCVLLNGTVISSPTLDAPIREEAIISGDFSQKEITNLAKDLQAGSLSYAPKIISETNISAELGTYERRQGLTAVGVALVLVILAMVGYYRLAGCIAAVAVLFNLLIIWAALQMIQATLTLAGIAGIILTLGMAVDANVLVFERIREELRAGRSLPAAVQAGYKRAFTAIFDANLTTIIAGFILLSFDSGPMKAFAITLIIGIASSMFSSLFMTRVFFTWWAGRRSRSLKMLDMIGRLAPNFLHRSRQVVGFSISLIVLGSIALALQGSSIVGMEFTGGHVAHLEFVPDRNICYRDALGKALASQGATPTDFQIRSLQDNHHVRVCLRPQISEMAQALSPNLQTASSLGQSPELSWLISALESTSLHLNPATLPFLQDSFSSMSPQFSQHVQQQAILALLLAFLGIFLYLAFRFTRSYALSALLCLIHDVAISLGFIALARYLGMPLQLDLHAVAALLTIVGYSLNDTIVVFDRIREIQRKNRTSSFPDLVEKAIRDTLSRTVMTSFTTLLPLLALLFLGGATIFNFAFIMAVGVIFGTISSLFIAGPLLLFFEKKQYGAS